MNQHRPAGPLASVDPGAVSLGTLLQVADLEAITGVLRVGDAGTVSLTAGVPTDATCDAHTGLDAFYELFIEAPTVDVLSLVGAEARPDNLGRRPLPSLILEGARRADEWARVHTQVLSPTAALAGLTLDGGAASLRTRLAEGASVAEACESAGLPRHVVANLVSQWLDQRLVDPVGTRAAPLRTRNNVAVNRPPERAAQAEPTAQAGGFYDHLDTGRRALRDGDLTAARAAFEAATHLRPDDRVARQNLRRVESLLLEATP